MMFDTVGYEPVAAAWRQQEPNHAARAAQAASVSAPESRRAAPAAAASAVRANAPEAFEPVAEIPYIPNGYGPEDLAARTRAEYPGLGSPIDPEDEWVKRLGSPYGEENERLRLTDPSDDRQDEKMEFHFLGEDDEDDGKNEDEDENKLGVSGVKDKKSAADVMNEGRCQTCAKRKYQDGSDDPGVSFKFATRVDPKAAQAKVRGHELEHVIRERAKAKMEGRKVVSQSVTYHTGICPECGKFYISGGTTRTVTAADNTKDILDKLQKEKYDSEDFDISA